MASGRDHNGIKQTMKPYGLSGTTAWAGALAVVLPSVVLRAVSSAAWRSWRLAMGFQKGKDGPDEFSPAVQIVSHPPGQRLSFVPAKMIGG